MPTLMKKLTLFLISFVLSTTLTHSAELSNSLKIDAFQQETGAYTVDGKPDKYITLYWVDVHNVSNHKFDFGKGCFVLFAKNGTSVVSHGVSPEISKIISRGLKPDDSVGGNIIVEHDFIDMSEMRYVKWSNDQCQTSKSHSPLLSKAKPGL
ncbi:DUF4354 family protein (plasmid) [Erwinia persicina]|uniref:DUF4354 family protein n=1 Tax=Erwinia persicina TaxID=55211 RepID=UPI0021083236|nr:DUF4354 family protein [Erwinia persicina]MCQ4105885.1 DUF4354 family protein [Erwinia persicina]UTX15171.1 DUF4354 family protein [Erwinia persicina]